jgi:hypothetical protein
MPPPMIVTSWAILFQPGWVAGLGEPGQFFAIALRIHAGPKTGVFVDVQLTIARQFHEGIAFQDAALIFRKAFQEIAVEKEIAAVDPMIFQIGLFGVTAD